MWGLYPRMGGAFCRDVDDSEVLISIGFDHGHDRERAGADGPVAGCGSALRQGLNQLQDERVTGRSRTQLLGSLNSSW